MISVKLIKNDEDYKKVLNRIDAIFDAEPNTQEGEELELLVTLVELYEKETYPIEAPDPISAIKFRMEQLGLKNNDLIPYIGSKSKVSEVLSGKRQLSLNMIRKLHETFHIPAEVLIKEPDKKLCVSEVMKHGQNFPFTEMFNRGWFKDFCVCTLNEAKEYKEEILTKFVSNFAIQDFLLCYNRKSETENTKIIDDILLAWRIRVMNVAYREKLPTWNKMCLSDTFFTELARLSYFDEGPRLAKEYLNKAGIHLIIEEHLKGSRLDGSAMLMPDGSPLISLTLRYDRLDSFWFTLFHELAHVKYHLSERQMAYFDDITDEMSKQIEKEADIYAKKMLISDELWEQANLSASSTFSDLACFARNNKISIAIPAGRIRYESGNYRLFSNLLGNGTVRKMFLI